MKTLKYYIVTDSHYDYNHMYIYTVCESEKHCKEFIDKYLLLKNYEHYKSWCELRKINYQKEESWKLYKQSTEISSDLTILKIKNTLNNVLSMIRVENNCPVVGCSYETDFERDRAE